ncbi:MAG: hypothetical protein ABII00_08425, partial [Elusimicrobiota bacterium]
LVVMNTSGDQRSAEMWVDANLSPPGSPLADMMDQGYSATPHGTEGGGSKLSVDVPAHGLRILVRRPRDDPPASDPG